MLAMIKTILYERTVAVCASMDFGKGSGRFKVKVKVKVNVELYSASS